MTRLERVTRDTFRSLRARNYRLFFLGQIVSISGTWMQGIAQAWLVLQMTGSGTVLGLTTGLQFLPLLLFGPWAGVVVDRVDKRRVLLFTQSTAATLALLLGAITALGVVQLWMVLALAFAFGCVVAIDNPARQSFLLEMVGPEDLPNAVTLNSVVINAARAIGPAVGGLVIAAVGVAACFFVNGVSYVAVLGALAAMRPEELHLGKRAVRGPKQLREGLAYVWRTPALRVPLLVMAAVGTLTYEFHVTLPLLAKFTFGGGPLAYGIISAVMGAGAVIGGLASARRSDASVTALLRYSAVFGVLILAVAAAPTLPLAVVALFAVGAASIRFIATANAALQLGAAPEMRGRVMALWGVAFLGSTPIGGPIIGWVGQTHGARAALAVGGIAAIAAAAAGWRAIAGRHEVRHGHPRLTPRIVVERLLAVTHRRHLSGPAPAARPRRTTMPGSPHDFAPAGRRRRLFRSEDHRRARRRHDRQALRHRRG